MAGPRTVLLLNSSDSASLACICHLPLSDSSSHSRTWSSVPSSRPTADTESLMDTGRTGVTAIPDAPVSAGMDSQGKTLAVLRKFGNNSVERDVKDMFREDQKKMTVLLFYLSLLETFPDSLCFCGFKSQVLLFHLLKYLLGTFCGVAGMRASGGSL